MTDHNNEIAFEEIENASHRIKEYIRNTPLITKKKINQELGSEIFFKCESLQETNSFKARGAFNAILAYREKYKKFPEKIVAHSSGNHAQAIAYASKMFGIEAIIYMEKSASIFKIKAARSFGAEVIVCDTRAIAIKLCAEKQKEGYLFIHPSDNDDVIFGQATATLESIHELGEVDAIFAPVGGGGLISGAFLVAKKLSPKAKVIGCEPVLANDAVQSVRNGEIFSFENSPNTIADGVRTLAVSKRCFNYLRQINNILEIPEEEIISWQERLSQILEIKVEPTSALAIAGAVEFLKRNNLKNQKILVIISGGNYQ